MDDHRQVNTGILRIEYSGGTHIYTTGVPVAVVLGDDEFDFRSLILEAPEEYEILLEGEPLEVSQGVYEFVRSLEVTAPGLEIQASAGTVMVGIRGVTFVLHR